MNAFMPQPLVLPVAYGLQAIPRKRVSARDPAKRGVL